MKSILGCLATLLFCAPSFGATYTVNTPYSRTDANPGDGVCSDGTGLCSVNTAIQEANAHAGQDTINIPYLTTESGHHFLSSVEITDSVVIQGTSTPPILETIGARWFSVAAGATVQMANATLTGDWMAIHNYGTLNLFSVTVTGITTVAGDFYNDSPITNHGTLSIGYSNISNNVSNETSAVTGGAITNFGNLIISASELSHNQSAHSCGGAILNVDGGTLDIRNSHFEGNSANSGGALCNFKFNDANTQPDSIKISQSSFIGNTVVADGGAIFQSSSEFNSVRMSNSTLSGNQANGKGGAIYTAGGSFEMASSTIAYNTANADRNGSEDGGGIHLVAGTVANMKNTILAKNSRLAGPTLSLASDCAGALQSDGYNLIGYNCGVMPQLGDLYGAFSQLDPQMGALISTGITSYHPLAATSPAVDSGNFDGCKDYAGDVLAVDQLGTDRAQGFVCDMGAAESANFAGRILTYPISGLATTEAGGQSQVNIRLNGNPSNPVTVGVASSDTSEGIVSAFVVTVNPGTPLIRVVAVTGVDDDIDDGDVNYSINFGASISSDSRFDGIDPNDRPIVNLDDDVAGITVVTDRPLHCTEAGGQDAFSVQLDTQPMDDVNIALEVMDTSEVSISPNQLVFNAGNWDQAQTVTVTGLDDSQLDGNQTVNILFHPVESTDPVYDGMLPDLYEDSVQVTNADDDVAELEFNPPYPGALETSESGSQDSYTLVLASDPEEVVQIALTASDAGEWTVSPNLLTFNSSNWNIPQTVTVTGVDDYVDEGALVHNSITHEVQSAKLLYNFSRNYYGDNLDDDSAGYAIVPAAGLLTTELGGEDSFTVALTSEPVADVVIPNLRSQDTSEIVILGEPRTLTFTPQNWSTPQPVVVQGVDDTDVDGNSVTHLVHDLTQSADTFYAGLLLGSIQVTNLDDESDPILECHDGDLTLHFNLSGSRIIQVTGALDTDGTVRVLTGANLALEVGSSVTFNPGFSVQANSNMAVSVGPLTCNP